MVKKLFVLTVCLLCAAWETADAREIKVLQLNIWQEGTSVSGGYESLIDEIAYADADFVMLSEVRNYNDTRFCDRIVESLKAKGKTYYSFKSKDSGLLSKYPVSDSVTIFPEKDDHGSLYKLVAVLPEGRKVSVYTAHLDYTNCAYYRVRGYDGSTWAELPEPDTNLESILADNVASQRDDAIRLFIEDAARDAAAGHLIFLGGDFNEPSHLDWTEATKDSADHRGLVVPWTVATLLDEAGYADSYRVKYPNPVTHPGYTYPADCPGARMSQLLWAPKADERERIDFIFYRPDKRLKLKDVTIFGPKGSVRRGQRMVETSQDPFLLPATGNWPTDHKGVLATFRVK
ncbi:endonuclease/exonuclease/phosphatase family protein [uncultured Rikenella sp.]|uniref:endonuclease/exonuclease/phosphatase family protein n=1 Tax=uncultured Rikenella sp. TaxID=368003 RepID=UPI00262B471E|nr:endonuclease/exonuclease/phosphatase family protein [uncultured Rikenella sp.]